MRCIKNLMGGEKNYVVYEVDEGCGGYCDGLKGGNSVEYGDARETS
jgi:hypothetical protein